MSARAPLRFAPERAPLRFAPEGWVPLAAGGLWLAWVGSAGPAGFALALLPGGLLVGSGVSMLLWPGDPRVAQFAALGGFASALLAWVAMLIAGLPAGLALFLASLAAIPAAGRYALRLEPHHDGVPAAQPSLLLAAQTATDEAILAGLILSVPLPAPASATALRADFERAAALFRERGWLDDPLAYHRTPPRLEAPSLRERAARGRRFEHLVFESEYEPWPEEPGRERAIASGRNRRAHAWVLRHPDGPRPWVVCIHGYGMGAPVIDLPAFGAAWLHERLGLNAIFPVLPHHGPRGGNGRSGRRFFTADFVGALHGQAQAIWDIRRLLSWVRAQGAPSVGVYGLSMGGHVAALLASIETDLDCVICGIPVTDLVRLAWRHAPPFHLHRFEQLGLRAEDADALLRPVSALQLAPQVAHERRFLFGGTADRLVPPDQVRDLWLHWEKPRLAWYHGSHMTFGLDPGVRRLVRDGLVSLLDEQREHADPSLRVLFSV